MDLFSVVRQCIALPFNKENPMAPLRNTLFAFIIIIITFRLIHMQVSMEEFCYTPVKRHSIVV